MPHAYGVNTLAYDWLYDKIPPDHRESLRRFLVAEAHRLYLYNETIVGNIESNNGDPWIGAGYGMVGLALKDSGIRQKLDIIVVAIKRADGEMLFNPTPETFIYAEDTLIALGFRHNLEGLEEMAGA